MAVADELLKIRSQIGWQRWGMAVLYFRAGLKQEDIARVFGVRRQMVHYHIEKALRVASDRLSRRRLCERNRGPDGGVSTPPRRRKRS